jgi:hypothetical protein
MSRMSWLAAVLSITVLYVPIARSADPPKPNPKAPVDYVKWINEEFGRDVKENAADLYQQAIVAVVENDGLAVLGAQSDAAKWTDEQRGQLKEWVGKNGKCLEHFAAAGRISKCHFRLQPEGGPAISVLVPECAKLRHIARLAATRARVRMLDGDLAGATDDITAMFCAGRHLSLQPLLIQHLVGIAIGALGYDALLDIPRLAAGTVDYDNILSKLKRFDREPVGPDRAFQAEKIMAWDMVQRFLKDTDGDGQYDSLEIPRELGDVMGTDAPAGPVKLRPQSLEAAVNEIAEHFDRWTALANLGYPEAKRQAAALDEQVSKKETVLRIVAPAFHRVLSLHGRLVASRNAGRVVMELHAYHAKNGKWPADLEQGLSKSTAKTALDAFSGKPFVYQLKDGEPFLYSVSENGVDDHAEVFRKDGKPAWGETGDYVFWPRQKE